MYAEDPQQRSITLNGRQYPERGRLASDAVDTIATVGRIAGEIVLLRLERRAGWGDPAPGWQALSNRGKYSQRPFHCSNHAKSICFQRILYGL
ncbi:hypothetical protein KAJ71_18125 [Serratia sp. arafor3]|uniref:DCD domain-containing protein n=1 Tax=Serratia silvae TaxID=2824122 RepID=A0ABT0KFV4_9GAMM|nr:hypothetical protein [Serratia silvae]